MLKSYLAFDVETTGLSPESDEIIEIGALKVQDGKVCDRFITFVKPSEPVSERITEITGITNEMLQDAAPKEKVIPAFLDFCGDEVLIGHNLPFDYGFVKNQAKLFGLSFEKQGIDTLKIARSVHKGRQSNSLEALCTRYSIVNSSAHRAYHDALATAEAVSERWPIIMKTFSRSFFSRRHCRSLPDRWDRELPARRMLRPRRSRSASFPGWLCRKM